MRLLDHPNVVQLKHCFFSTTDKDELYLNLVLEYVSETVYRVSKRYIRLNQHMPLIYVRLYTYQVSFGSIFILALWDNPAGLISKYTVVLFCLMQICRALNYLHNVVGVCHRDIKPQNLLVRFPCSYLISMVKSGWLCLLLIPWYLSNLISLYRCQNCWYSLLVNRESLTFSSFLCSDSFISRTFLLLYY